MRHRLGWRYVALALLAAAGCHKPYFMTEVDYDFYNRIAAEPSGRSADADILQTAKDTPPNILDLGAQREWRLTLEEAKRLAVLNNRQIAVVAYQPGEAGTRIDRALSAFDAVYSTGGTWARTERQVANIAQGGRDAFVQNAFGNPAGGFGLLASDGIATGSNLGGARSGIPGFGLFDIRKQNATGGVTAFNYSLDYQRNNPIGFATINPQWSGTARLTILQPVLKGAGVEFNRSETLIARANFEQSIKDFDTQVRTLLRDVENAYWQLSFTYSDQYSRQIGLRGALLTWQKQLNRFEAGDTTKQDVAQSREQYELFRGQLYEAQQRILTAEGTLRRLLGLPPDDGRRLVPIENPTEAEYAPDWQTAVLETMENRPELSAQRYAVRAAEIELSRQKNGLLPDLSLSASYGLSGLDNQLDQSFNRLLSNRFSEWTLGIAYQNAIGKRAANANVRQAQLILSRQNATLRNLEQNFLHELREAYQNIFTRYALIGTQRLRRLAAADQLDSALSLYEKSARNATVDFLVRTQATFVDTLRDEAQAIANYNQALIQWEFVKGTILVNDNVLLTEEICSVVPDSVKLRIQRQFDRSKPLPIHRGSHVHLDTTQCPDTSLPLYPLADMAAPETIGLGSPLPSKPEEKPAREEQPPVVPAPAPKHSTGATPPKTASGNDWRLNWK